MEPYGDDRSKKEQVREMFDGIAPRYDLLNRILSLGIDRGWRRRTAKTVAERRPERVLDLATGTGDLAVAIARRTPGAMVTGLDVSEGMLAAGREKIAAKGLSNRVELMCGDGERLPLENGSFDCVTVAFGIRNFGDPQAGLHEAARVLRPDGMMAVLEFSKPRGKVFGPLYRFYFRRILPFVGGLVSGDRKAYKYLHDSAGEFPDGERFLDMMRKAGFSNCTAKPLTFGIATIYIGNKQNN